MSAPPGKIAYIFNNRAHMKRFSWAMAILCFCGFLGILHWQDAFAFSINGASFSCSGGTASGDLFQTTTAGTSLSTAIAYQAAANANGNVGGAVAIFSGVLQFFQETVGQIMSNMYCSMQNMLLGPLTAAMTIFVVVFGILIATGMTRFNKTEAAVTLFKMGLVWAFATNADWGIGIGYRFFMGLAQEGSNIVLTAICGASGVPTLNAPDTIFGGIFSMLTGGTGTLPTAGSSCLSITGGTPAPDISSLSSTCKNWMMIFFGSLAVFSPGITSFAAIMVVQYITLYARALLGYLASIVLISFLFILSPIFISFALFKATAPLFQKWLGYLTSFSLQMIVIFAFLALLAVVAGQLSNSVFMIVGLLREYDTTWGTWVLHVPMTMCGICDTYNFNDSANSLAGVSCTGGTAHPDAISSVDGGNVITLLNLFQHQDLVVFVLSQTLAWWLIAYVLQEFLQKAPELAQKLGGMPFATLIPGDPGLPQLPGTPGLNYPGLSTTANGLQNLAGRLTNSTVGRTAGGLLAATGLYRTTTGSGGADGSAPSTPRPGIGASALPTAPRTQSASAPPSRSSSAPAGDDSDATPAPIPAAQQPQLQQMVSFVDGKIKGLNSALTRAETAGSLSKTDIQEIRARLQQMSRSLNTVASEHDLGGMEDELKYIEGLLH